MKFIRFDHNNKKIVIAKTVGNVVYLKRISWDEMHSLTMEMLRREVEN